MLKAYKKLLIIKKSHPDLPGDVTEPAFVEKRRLILEKITQDIVNRMLHSEYSRGGAVTTDEKGAGEKDDTQFIYNSITCEKGKETRFLAMESSDFLIKNVERLAGNGSDGYDADTEIDA